MAVVYFVRFLKGHTVNVPDTLCDRVRAAVFSPTQLLCGVVRA